MYSWALYWDEWRIISSDRFTPQQNTQEPTIYESWWALHLIRCCGEELLLNMEWTDVADD